MSIVKCEFCNKNIDTDFDVEHFVNADMTVCENEEADTPQHDHRGYHITRSGDPYNGRYFMFYHHDYCGAPDSGDWRHGHAETEKECYVQIDELIYEN